MIIGNYKHINNFSDNEENNMEKKNSTKIISIYKNKNYNKKDSNGYGSFLSKSNINSYSNISNITISDSNTNNYLNNYNININKNLKTNFNNTIISVNDLYYLLIFKEKIKDIFDCLLLNKNNFISNYCYEAINFFYNYSISKYIQNIISDKIELNNLNLCNNYTLFAIVLFYDLSFNQNNFMNVILLIK